MSLEEMKIKVELAKVSAARAEMEYVIAQRLDEIERIKRSIDSQDKRIEELNKLLQGL